MSETTALKTCPRCNSPATEIMSVDSGMRLVLQEANIDEAKNLPAQVCDSCYSQLTSLVSKGAKLRLEQHAREKNKHMLWKSRVNLIKQARQKMTQKAFADAAISYEKYIRVLEIAYDLKPGMLNPTVFGKSSKSKELTVIATTYWDLMRIYDTNPNYRDRMNNAAKKLAEFLPYSPIFPDVIKKAQTFQSSAKNPDIVRNFMKLVKANNPRCFIATAAFGSADESEVLYLRHFRDRVLLPTPVGRAFVSVYYQVSPPVARWMARRPWAQKYTQRALKGVVGILTKIS